MGYTTPLQNTMYASAVLIGTQRESVFGAAEPLSNLLSPAEEGPPATLEELSPAGAYRCYYIR